VSDDQLLYKNPGLWENAINVAIILKNSHRFRTDPEYGEIMMRMWKGTSTEDDFKNINQRLIGVGKDSLKVPTTNENTDISYACWSNMDRNAVHAASFKEHIKHFPSYDSDELPPNHTIIVEADISEAPLQKPKNNKNSNDNREEVISNQRNKAMRVRIDPIIKSLIYSRLGDHDVRDKNKPIDPALKLYVGAHCMINENDNVKEGRANGTMCRVRSIKRKSTTPLNVSNYDGKKVYSIGANDIDYIEFDHYPPTPEQEKLLCDIDEMEKNSVKNIDEIQHLRHKLEVLSRKRRFRLQPKTSYVTFHLDSLKRNCNGSCKHRTRVRAKLKQFPIILNDATTGYKLQGSTKNQIILQSIDYQTSGWLYTALSRVRRLKGLFLCEKINFQSFASRYERAKNDLLSFDSRIQMKIPTKLK
jgi:hypothetical protein